jgi:hypothetical protein
LGIGPQVSGKGDPVTDDEQPARSGGADDEVVEPEIVDGVIVLASARTIEPTRDSGAPPLRQVAAVAATGFVAGAATAAVLGRRLARRQAVRSSVVHAGLRPAGAESLEVVGSRRFIVDVHALTRR